MNLYFTFECRNFVNLYRYTYRSKHLLRLNITDSVQFQKKIRKNSHCGSRFPKYVELGHFTLLFRRGRQRNVQRFKMHVHSYCLLVYQSPDFYRNLQIFLHQSPDFRCFKVERSGYISLQELERKPCLHCERHFSLPPYIEAIPLEALFVPAYTKSDF